MSPAAAELASAWRAPRPDPVAVVGGGGCRVVAAGGGGGAALDLELRPQLASPAERAIGAPTESARRAPSAELMCGPVRAPRRLSPFPGDDRRHREPEMRDPVGQVEMEPTGDAVRQRREDDLVEVAVVQRLLD